MLSERAATSRVNRTGKMLSGNAKTIVSVIATNAAAMYQFTWSLRQ
jgi:hypothetical protein